MRKAKKWMSLALAVIMTTGLMAVPAQAAYTLADFQPVTLKGLYDRYDKVGEFQYGVAFVGVDTDKNGWLDVVGLVDATGKEIVTPTYDADLGMFPQYTEDGIAKVTIKTFETAYIDTMGKIIISVGMYGSDSRDFSEGLAAVQNSSGKWGYIDKNGKTVIPFIYEDAQNFSEGLAAVSKESRDSYGYINKQGEMVIPVQYDIAEEFKGGYAIVELEIPEKPYSFGSGIIDTKGNVVVPITEDSLAKVTYKHMELIESAGKADYVTKTINGTDYRFYDGCAIQATVPGSGTLTTPPFLRGAPLTFVDYGVINPNGERITSNSYELVENYFHGFAVAQKGDKYGLLDTSGSEVLRPEYKWITSFNKSGTATACAENGDVIILTAPQTVDSFTDVSATAYYRDAVKWAVDKKITAGTSATKFSPDATCTDAQILTFLWRANGQPEPTIANPFADVKANDYYYKAALWASEKGLIAGTTLGADTPCTRSAVVAYLWKLAGQPAATKAASFTDVDSNADYATAVAWAVEQGITGGTSATTFTPDGICTRGQIVTFLFRAMGK